MPQLATKRPCLASRAIATEPFCSLAIEQISSIATDCEPIVSILDPQHQSNRVPICVPQALLEYRDHLGESHQIGIDLHRTSEELER